jgi:surface antigen
MYTARSTHKGGSVNLMKEQALVKRMKQQIKLPLLLILSSSLLMGCHSLQYMSEQERAGTVLGAVGGGIIGGQFGHGAGAAVGAGVGAVIGGVLGNALGQTLDDVDRQDLTSSYTKASRVPVGETICWSNTCTEKYGSFTPVRDGYHTDYGYYCCEYSYYGYMGGSKQRVYGVACRHPNGTWYKY